MAAGELSDSNTHLSASEAAHLVARDRKRTTRMVVDNAGVKRILQAQRERAARRKAATAGRSPAAGRHEG